MVKNLPADVLLQMKSNEYTILFNKEGSYFYFDHIEIHNPKMLSTFAHELGHGKDFDKTCNRLVDYSSLSNNKDFLKSYELEKAAYIKAFSGVEKTKMEYLIGELGPYQYGLTNSDTGEVIADINALLSGYSKDDSEIRPRLETLQRYFPRTIAAAAKLLNPNVNIAFEE